MKQTEIFQLACRYGKIAVSAKGAHLLDYTPANRRPVIWLNEKIDLGPCTPIRGGNPVCWPWFGQHLTDPALPGHGLVRLEEWSLLEKTERENGALLRLGFTGFGGELEMKFELAQSLEMTLSIRNVSGKPLKYSAGFHTYFAVSSIGGIAIHGLENCPFLRRPEDVMACEDGPVTFHGSRVTRVYAEKACGETISDPAWQRTIRVTPRYTEAAVVWNPGQGGWRDFAGFSPDDEEHFVCLETVIPRGSERIIPVGEIHRLGMNVDVE